MDDPHVHEPRQGRSRRTLARIIEAALELLAERGAEGTTIQAIVQRAESSVGSFYARFDGKDDLLGYLEARVWEDAERRWQSAMAGRSWDGAELSVVIEGLAGVLVQTYRADLRQRAALSGRDGANGAGARAAEFRRLVSRDVRTLLMDRRDEMRHPDPAFAIDFGLTALVGAVREMHERSGESARTEEGEARRVKELARLYLSYLGQEVGGEDDAPDMEFFDIWG